MNVVFIGAGNVASHLAEVLFRHSFNIVQIYSRTIESASLLASKVKAIPLADIRLINPSADLYIFSVKDLVLKEVVSQMPSTSGLWIHTSGSMPMDSFKGFIADYGVFYPFQTFSKTRQVDWSALPIFIEANSEKSLHILKKLGTQLSSSVRELSSEDRRYVHLTGVFASNFTNHMYTLSQSFLDKVGLPFDVCLPLIDETAAKVHELTPEQAQTGPAVRYDRNVIDKHLELVEDEGVKELYKLISENIHKVIRNEHDKL